MNFSFNPIISDQAHISVQAMGEVLETEIDCLLEVAGTIYVHQDLI
jgi:hypothetical protein